MWDDYLTWPDDERWEIIHGRAFAMAPSPVERHQLVVSMLTTELTNFFKGKSCHVIASPMDVKLSKSDVVQPDVLVVCDPHQFKGHIEGPPALVAEVLSPSTAGYDRIEKLQLYAEFKIKEYWIIQPFPAILEVLALDGNSYRVDGTYRAEHTLKSPLFPELRLSLKEIFNLPIPPEEKIREVHESRAPYRTKRPNQKSSR